MSLRVLVIAPTGRDAELVVRTLAAGGVAVTVWDGSWDALCIDGDAPLGPLLIAQEALSPGLMGRVGELMRGQPAWSDLPILILTGSGPTAPGIERLGATILL